MADEKKVRMIQWAQLLRLLAKESGAPMEAEEALRVVTELATPEHGVSYGDEGEFMPRFERVVEIGLHSFDAPMGLKLLVARQIESIQSARQPLPPFKEIVRNVRTGLHRQEFAQSMHQMLPAGLLVEVSVGVADTLYHNGVVDNACLLYTDGCVVESSYTHSGDKRLLVTITGASYVFQWELCCYNPGKPLPFFGQMVRLSVYLSGDPDEDAALLAKVVAAIGETMNDQRLMAVTDASEVHKAIRVAAGIPEAPAAAQ